MIIENLRMRMIDEEAPVQFIDAHRPFKLKKKHILDVRGVYDSNITLTEWNADMVVKIYAPAAGWMGRKFMLSTATLLLSESSKWRIKECT